MKNIFVTGPMRIGKSSIIKKILNSSVMKHLKIDGYFTVPEVEGDRIVGYSIRDFYGSTYNFAHVDLANELIFDRYHINPTVFDNFASGIITRAMKEADIFVVDEIGVIESDASLFKNQLLACLNSDLLCIGVFQERAGWFKTLIHGRPDTQMIYVTSENRNNVHQYILREMKK